MCWSGLAEHAYLQTALGFVVTYVVQDDVFAQLHVLGEITGTPIEAYEKPGGQAPAVVAQNDFIIKRHPSAQQYSACVPRRSTRCMITHAPFPLYLLRQCLGTHDRVSAFLSGKPAACTLKLPGKCIASRIGSPWSMVNASGQILAKLSQTSLTPCSGRTRVAR